MFKTFLQTYEAFKTSGAENPLFETLHLLDILSNGALRELDRAFQDQASIELSDIVQKRKQGVPIEYSLGRATFMGLDFYCSPEALIPRAETELLVGTVLDIIQRIQLTTSPLTIVDIGTGSGNIAISLAKHTQNTFVLASDISSEALWVAQQNVIKHNVQGRVTLLSGDLFAPLSNLGIEESVDIVVCNPPYIPTNSLAKLAPGIIEHEPLVALDAGAYGIDIFRRLVYEGLLYL
jgi:release factor glutamine methyltransferase